MNKLVLLALVAVFAVAAAQDITDIKIPSLKNKTNHTLPIMPRTMAGHANVSGKANLTNSLPVVRGCPNGSLPLPASSQPLVFKLSRSLLNRSDRANRTNKTNKTREMRAYPRGGLQDEEFSETSSFTDDFEAYHLARSNNNNKTNKTDRLINRQNKTKNTTTTTSFFETLKNWLFGGKQQQEEVNAEEIEDFIFNKKSDSRRGEPSKVGVQRSNLPKEQKKPETGKPPIKPQTGEDMIPHGGGGGGAWPPPGYVYRNGELVESGGGQI
jgi:hypothetical protein